MANIAVEGPQQSAAFNGARNEAEQSKSIMTRVAKAYEVSSFQQFRDALKLRFGPRKLRSREYYDLGLYDPAMPMAEKQQYVGAVGSTLLNRRLARTNKTKENGLPDRRLQFAGFLNQMGVPAPHAQAVFGTDGGFGRVTHLRDSEELKRFLSDNPVHPILCTPWQLQASASHDGSNRRLRDALLMSGDAPERIDAFVQEAKKRDDKGHILLSIPRAHSELACVAGFAPATVRLVTVADQGRPRLLYAIWAVPPDTDVIDAPYCENTLLAALNVETGRVMSCRVGRGPDARDVSHHPDTQGRIIDRVLPHWRATIQAAEAAHSLFPSLGIGAWTLAIGDDGPVVLACDDNPSHVPYQLAYGRGIYNRDFAQIWNTAGK